MHGSLGQVPTGCGRAIEAHQIPVGAHGHEARRVLNLERSHRGVAARRGHNYLGVAQFGATRCAQRHCRCREFISHDLNQAFGRGQNLLEFHNLSGKLSRFLLEFQAAELCQSTQAQLQNVVGLRLAEVKDGHERGSGAIGIIARANHLNDFINVGDGNEQTGHKVEALLSLSESERRASCDHCFAVFEVHLE